MNEGKRKKGTEKRNVVRERERDASQQHTPGIAIIFRSDGRREVGKLL